MPDRTIFGSIDGFRAAAQQPEAPANAHVRASLDTEIKKPEGDSRTLTFAISSPSVDRMGDTIAVAGWKLDNYRKNPVVLFGHDASSLPVAKATKVWIEGDRLMAEAEFTPKGMARFNDTVFDMLKGGFLNATSVGFAPLRYAFTDDPQRRFGIDFLEQELLEFSVVPVPANPDALLTGKAAGIDVEPMVEWHKAALASIGLSSVPAARLSAIEALPKKFRSIAKGMPDSAKGARGQFRRIANDIEEALGVTAEASDPAASAVEKTPRETPRLVMARRRLEQARRKLA
jgi:HK97 family phage prohead protease